jgi:hypothetical protein
LSVRFTSEINFETAPARFICAVKESETKRDGTGKDRERVLGKSVFVLVAIKLSEARPKDAIADSHSMEENRRSKGEELRVYTKK